MQAIILAAGRGTRLGSLTASRSKGMMPVAGRPLVGRVADSLLPIEPDALLVVVRPGDLEIRAFFDGEQWPCPVRLVEQPEPRGMADALLRCAPHIGGDFLLSACDSLVPAAEVVRLFERWRAEPRPDALLSLLPSPPEKLSTSGVVALAGEQVTRIIEKPRPEEAPSSLLSLPLYLFRPGILTWLPALQPSPRGELELQDAIQRLIDSGARVIGHPVSGRRTVTTASDLLRLNLEALEEGVDVAQAAGLPANVVVRPPARVEPGAMVGKGCVLGPRVYVEQGGCVGEGARLRDTVVLRGGVVEAGATLAGVLVG